MTKIDVVSGFLGAGKTTLIKKLLKEALDGSKTVLIENEFGEIGIDGGFLKEAGIEIKEMNSGCICCSLVGDFGASLKEVISTYAPERILIEPSGVGKLSDVLKAVEDVASELEVQVNSAVAVVDASKAKMYIKNFGEFFINQIQFAGTIILSRTDKVAGAKLEECVQLIRQHNSKATIITTSLDQLDGRDVLETIEGADTLDEMMREMLAQVQDEHEHHHHHDHDGHHHHDHDEDHAEHEHHHHDHDEDHDHSEYEHRHHDHSEDHDHGEHEHHYHDHDDDHDHGEREHHHHDHDEDHDHGEHDHHHHDHDDDHTEHDHHHHHDHDENHGHTEHDHYHDHDDDHGHDEHGHHHHDHDDHGHHHHHHHHHHHDHDHHHADEVFTSWGKETPAVYSSEKLESILTALDSGEYGAILRAKGMVPSVDGTWIYFDYVPEEHDIRSGKPEVTGKLCVIGAELKEEKLEELFRV